MTSPEVQATGSRLAGNLHLFKLPNQFSVGAYRAFRLGQFSKPFDSISEFLDATGESADKSASVSVRRKCVLDPVTCLWCEIVRGLSIVSRYLVMTSCERSSKLSRGGILVKYLFRYHHNHRLVLRNERELRGGSLGWRVGSCMRTEQHWPCIGHVLFYRKSPIGAD